MARDQRAADRKLSEYRRRRREGRTPEPAGRPVRPSGEAPQFVVQQHDATTMHYDFRLECDGVLASWAVPKGPSMNPKDRRMAVRTEDHPLDYADFEGVIPDGEYGAGPVIVWDRGTYRNLTENLTEDDDRREVPAGDAIEAGHVALWLDGEKLRGGFALTRIASGEDERWLLVKMADDEADARRAPVRSQPESVLSGRTIDSLRERAR